MEETDLWIQCSKFSLLLKKISAKADIKKIPSDVIDNLTEEKFSSYLDNNSVPFPDLIIRTGGERRISNFLLWQSAYSELFFSDKLWPDWQAEDLYEAIRDFNGRERRYGGVTE